MAYGIQILTQSGLVDAYNLISFRVVDFKTVAGGNQNITFDLSNCVALNGKSYIFLTSSAFVNTSVDQTYYTTVDELTWNYNTTITTSSTLTTTVRSSTGQGNVTATLFAAEI